MRKKEGEEEKKEEKEEEKRRKEGEKRREEEEEKVTYTIGFSLAVTLSHPWEIKGEKAEREEEKEEEEEEERDNCCSNWVKNKNEKFLETKIFNSLLLFVQKGNENK